MGQHQINIKKKYNQIVELYQKQVNLSHRTSESIMLQQYSTPAPIGYLAGLYARVYLKEAGIKSARKQTKSAGGGGYKMFKGLASGNIEQYEVLFKDGRIYYIDSDSREKAIEKATKEYLSQHSRIYFEPSAGNGLLTIAAEPKYFIVNEIDKIRNRNLRSQGYKEVWKKDASEPFVGYKKHFDAVITNPPFGSLDAAVDYATFPIRSLEQLMALRALDTMKDTGRAAIIIGGHTKYDAAGRIQKGKNRIFFNYLFHYYHVDDVININGNKLYSRMGTGFNVRLILIAGRKTSAEGYAPLKPDDESKLTPYSPTPVDEFSVLFDRVKQNL